MTALVAVRVTKDQLRVMRKLAKETGDNVSELSRRAIAAYAAKRGAHFPKVEFRPGPKAKNTG